MSSSPFTLEGKRILVAGAAQGIGAGCAQVCADLGATLCVADVDLPQVEGRLASLARPDAHTAHRVDVADEASVDELVRDAVAALGGIDGAVCTAGVLFPAPFLEQTAAEWDRTFAVNARGAFLFAQRVARQMVEQGRGGRIVLYASIVGTSVVRRNNVAYCASKAAVAHAVRAMALELGPHDITVNAISPGSTETEMLVGTQVAG
ncbi:MAG: SDR family oxidoreductase, partial [Frankiaceae bacterium]|nr:SDR family oxidoreductase [Frankiaceae bacterium]